MAKEKPEILEFFSRFPNEPFEFVTVTDINIKEHPNYYKAIASTVLRMDFDNVLYSIIGIYLAYKIFKESR